MSPAEQLVDEDALRLLRPRLVPEPSLAETLLSRFGGHDWRPARGQSTATSRTDGVSSTGRRLLWNATEANQGP
jgi:hypothetical protein